MIQNKRQPVAILRLFLLTILLASAIAYGTVTTAISLRTLRQHGSGLANQQTPSGPTIPLLGITTQLEQYGPSERQAALARLHAAGFGWIRQRLDWAEIEPLQGQFQWQPSDAILADIGESGLVPILLLDGSPAWARADVDADNPLAPPVDPQDFANFAQAVAQRYQSTFYQLWDEPNIAPHWGSRWVEPIEYTRLLRDAGCAIRAVDPNAVIISAALAPTTDSGHAAIHEIQFLHRLIAATPPVEPLCDKNNGVQSKPFPHSVNTRTNIRDPNLFDVVAIQPYGFGHHPADSRQRRDVLNFQRAAHIRRALVAAGYADTPIWATRFGWNRTQNSPWASIPAPRQPEFVAAAIEHSRANWPWLQALGWHIDQPAAPRSDPVWGFALSDPLADQLGQAAQAPDPTAAIQPIRLIDLWRVPLLMLLLVIGVAWRLPSTISQIPVRHRLAQWLDHSAVRVPLWIGLLYAYHIATWPPLILLLWMLAAALLFHTPRDGLMLATILLPFHFRHKEIWLFTYPWRIMPVQAMLLCLLPALGCMVWGKWREIVRFREWGTIVHAPTIIMDLFAFVWLIINLLSYANIWHKAAYFRGLIDFAFVPLLLYFAVRLLIRTQAQWRQLLIAIWIGGLLVALIGWINWLGGSGPNADGVRRLVGPHYSPNHTALYLTRTFFVGIGLWLYYIYSSDVFYKRGRPKTQNHRPILLNLAPLAILLLSGMIIITLALLFTASRGALLLGLPCGALAFYLLLPQRNSARTISAMLDQIIRSSRRSIATLLSLSLLLSLFLSTYAARLANIATFWRRTQIWQATLQLWRDHLWVGVGADGFFWRYPAYILEHPLLDPNISHPHNIWLEYGAQWGVLGVVWLVGMLGVVVWTVRKQRRDLLIVGICAALVSGVAHGQVDAFTSLADIAGWNWLAVGLVCQARWLATRSASGSITGQVDQPSLRIALAELGRSPTVEARGGGDVNGWQRFYLTPKLRHFPTRFG